MKTCDPLRKRVINRQEKRRRRRRKRKEKKYCAEFFLFLQENLSLILLVYYRSQECELHIAAPERASVKQTFSFPF